mmetsp:Transcript_62782/g.93351  ORF Transcript_62782/g.93351 Transcript_62782/m.93351 type:complete len:319 (+) Transcript_62782:196-1152(+)
MVVATIKRINSGNFNSDSVVETFVHKVVTWKPKVNDDGVSNFLSALPKPRISLKQGRQKTISAAGEAEPDGNDAPTKQCLVGVVGGIGPAASVRLQDIIVKKDSLRCKNKGFTRENGFLADSHHTPLLVFNNPQIPNNNRGALGIGPSPVDALVDSASALQRAGADAVAFACTTAYTWKDIVSARSGVHILDLLQLVAKKVVMSGCKRVGLLDVDGTHASGRFKACLEEHGIEVVLPWKSEQKMIMNVVADIKMGVSAADGPLETLVEIVTQLVKRDGVSAVILGCTEVSSALGTATNRPDITYFDSLSTKEVRKASS